MPSARPAREGTYLAPNAISPLGVTGRAAGARAAIARSGVGLSVKDGEDTAVEVLIDGDRDATKHGAAQAALDLLGTVL